MQQVDIAIVGAGPVGLAFARSLAGSGLSLALIEQQPRQALAEPAFDGREIALTHASRQLLEWLGLWTRFPAADIAPLRQAKVMNGGSRFALDFVPPAAADELGWLVPNQHIRRAAWEAVAAQPGLRLIDCTRVTAVQREGSHIHLALQGEGQGTLCARLLVAADSRFSSVRRQLGIAARSRDFGKTMLVCRMRHEQSHHGVAWEWFGHGRTMALLPLNGARAGAVLTLAPARADELLAMDEAGFNRAVAECFEHRLGAMQLDSSRHAYPLVSVHADRFHAAGAALIGDAAVGMHPVTAHGFNLGLQGQARLARGILDALSAGHDFAGPAVLSAYDRSHRRATRPLYEATNAIAALYTDERLPARLLRDAALRMAARLPPFRRVIAAHLTQRDPGWVH
ncbi:MAG TPA: 5-demethoxyubiquinol-8 5-hydroxylase UbiM [Stenotrophomonas sp.]|nr:5-demethoxyubiquinol-8 5-hydroxylase UbiM [Stenotrophomonas sp.]